MIQPPNPALENIKRDVMKLDLDKTRDEKNLKTKELDIARKQSELKKLEDEKTVIKLELDGITQKLTKMHHDFNKLTEDLKKQLPKS